MIREDEKKFFDSLTYPDTANGRAMPLDPGADPLERSRADALANKAKRIEEILQRGSQEEQIVRFLTYTKKNGGLLEGRFRAKIWPLLAEHMNAGLSAEGDEKRSVHSVEEFIDADEQTLLNGSVGADSDFQSALSQRGSSSAMSVDEDEGIVDQEGSKSGDEEPTTPLNPSVSDRLRSHPEWNQVELDVHRTLARFPPNIDKDERMNLQGDLTPMIVEVLASNPDFKYYQGFHDVCLTLLLALDLEAARKVAHRLVERGAFRNYLTKSLEESAIAELRLIYVLLFQIDPELERHMREAELGVLFALSWPITWFSHALHSFDEISRCFDLFLSNHYLMPIYVSAALVHRRREAILACEPEMPPMHHLLNHIPAGLDIERVLEKAVDLYEEYSPEALRRRLTQEYDDMCQEERLSSRAARHSTPRPPARLDRNAALMVGVAAVGVTAYVLNRFIDPSWMT